MSLAVRLRGIWSASSLRRQLAAVIIVVGLGGLLLDAALISTLVHGDTIDHEGRLLANQATALSGCCGQPPELLLLARTTLLPSAIPVALAGTPERHAVVINGRGKLLYASPMPAGLEAALLARARADMGAPSLPRWSQYDGQLIAEGRRIRSITDIPPGIGGMILLAESWDKAGSQWRHTLALVLLAGLVPLTLIVVGAMIAAHAVARPVRAMTTAARSIAAGDYTQRAGPAGAVELRQLAGAFNAMVDEVQYQRQVERDLLANVSHELAAPLSLIRGYAEALADDLYQEEPERRQALAAIRAEATRLGRLTGDLLDLALLETGQVAIHREMVPVRELLTALYDRFVPLARQAGVALILDIPEGLPPNHTDGLRLEQVLLNLLANALRHTPEGGAVTLAATLSGTRLVMTVSDTGAGIPPEELPRVWERFYRVGEGRDRRPGEAGVGLGLPIVRGTMALLGGGSGAESAPGRGTTFTIWLPLK